MGFGGPPGGPTHPKGSHGLWEDVDQPLVGWRNPFTKAQAGLDLGRKETQRWKGFQVERRNPTPSRIGLGLLCLSLLLPGVALMLLGCLPVLVVAAALLLVVPLMPGCCLLFAVAVFYCYCYSYR